MQVQYGHIEGDSGLMTSQFHIGDSPKAIIDYSHSERIETMVQRSGIQTESQVRQRRSGERKSLIESSNMQLNKYQLPQIIMNCASPAVFEYIKLELKQYNYNCILKEPNQIMFLQTTIDPLCQKFQKQIFISSNIPSQSNNSIIFIKFNQQKLQIDAMSGNYKYNEETLLSIVSVVKQYNSTHKDFEPLDDLSHINPFAITAISTNRIYSYLEENQIFAQKFNQLLQNIDQLVKPKKQQLQQYMYEASQLVVETFQQFKSKTLKYDYQYYLMAIEKVIFEQVYDKIFHFYKVMGETLEIAYDNSKQLIITNYCENEMMDFLEIKKKFRLGQQFWLGISELNKIDKTSNPREKLRSIQQMLCLIKSLIFEMSNAELSTMDDELPVMIYIMLQCDFRDKFATIQYVDDFCNTDPTIETEKRTITTLRVSLEYIANEWKV